MLLAVSPSAGEGNTRATSEPSPDLRRGSVPAIHGFNRRKDVDARNKCGHDEEGGRIGDIIPGERSEGRESTRTLSAMDPLPGPADRRG